MCKLQEQAMERAGELPTADKNQGGAAVRGEAVAESDLTELIELLRSIRPNYGAVGSRDVDVTAMRKKIDAAITIISARAADAPSEPSEPLYFVRMTKTDGWREASEAAFWTFSEVNRRIIYQSRAADALDSQPTDPLDGDENVSLETACRNLIAFLDKSGPMGESLWCVRQIRNALVTQPTVAAQQGSIADDAIESAALKHVAVNWKMEPVAGYRTGPYTNTEQFRRLKAFALELLDSRAPAAPVAQLAPQTWIATADQMPNQYREVHLKNREGHVRIGRWSLKGGGSWQLACFGSGEQSLWRKDDVTHWCTLAALDVPQQEGSEASNG